MKWVTSPDMQRLTPEDVGENKLRVYAQMLVNAGYATEGDVIRDNLSPDALAKKILGQRGGRRHARRFAAHCPIRGHVATRVEEPRHERRRADERVAVAGLAAIVCVGETEAERDAGKTLDIVGKQVANSVPDGASAENTVVAYEPVWAIGTGRTPTTDEVQEVHAAIRAGLKDRFGAETASGIRLLYGGSMKPSNAAELLALADVDGGLIGGASLKAEDFTAIADAAS